MRRTWEPRGGSVLLNARTTPTPRFLASEGGVVRLIPSKNPKLGERGFVVAAREPDGAICDIPCPVSDTLSAKCLHERIPGTVPISRSGLACLPY